MTANHNETFIAVYDNALSPELCKAIQRQFIASQPQRGETGSGVELSWKDSYDINISTDPTWQSLHSQVMDITTAHLLRYMMQYPALLCGAIGTGAVDPATGEKRYLSHEEITEPVAAQLMARLYRPGQIQAQMYSQGQGGYHHWHSEIYPRDPQCETLHRLLLFMFYVNTVEVGGETEFLYQNVKISPVAGRMVIAPGGFTHTHKGHVPQSKDKLILTSWILFNRAETLYGQNMG